MRKIAFWNNKGGTGKTSLAFQTVCRYAEQNSGERILVIDGCPQANLSELLLGGLEGNGSAHLETLQARSPRASIAGYFQQRLPSPYNPPVVAHAQYIANPNQYNGQIPANIDLVAGDALVELQSNAMATLSNTQIPGTDTWLAVIDWLNDFLFGLTQTYQVVFIDTNPSFSIYTQIALATSEELVLPVMPDDSSRRALQNAFSLVHGVNLPSPIYSQYSFTTKLLNAGRTLPKAGLIVKNRLTQYMGSASAYSSVLTSIDGLLQNLLTNHPTVFNFSQLSAGLVEVRDFQTTGVVAFAEGVPFSGLHSGVHTIQGREVQVAQENINNCVAAIDGVVGALT